MLLGQERPPILQKQWDNFRNKIHSITKDSIPNHINSAKNALLSYGTETREIQFLDGKLIFSYQGTHFRAKSGINTGRLSGIVNHHVPNYLRTNQLPLF